MKLFIYASGLLLITMLLSGCQTKFHYNDLAVIAFVLITIIVGLFLVLAIYSNILRDEVSDCDEFDANAQKLQQKQKRKLVNKRYPFSITKVQFGVWTVIISSSYIYLSLLKGDCSEGPINKTALVLMGIFAGTAVASTIIDKNEINDNRLRHQNAPSEGFFIDILSDDNGISLHRFQSFTWTIIAMTIYLYKVYKVPSGCVLPELSDTLLALTGISSATYLVMRSKENDPPVQEPVQPARAANINPIITPTEVSKAAEPVKTPVPS
jgi:preprotein translocase subunit SecG